MLPIRVQGFLRNANGFLRIVSKNLAASIINKLNTNNHIRNSSGGSVYKKVWTKHDLIEHMSNVYYEDEFCVVVNKPYGILPKPIQTTESCEVLRDISNCESTVSDVLPDLAARFGVEKLSVIIQPDRIFSGVTILSKGTQRPPFYCFNTLQIENRIFSFATVVSGQPSTEQGSFILHQCQNEKRLKILDDNKKNRKLGRMIRYKQEVLASSDLASLLRIDLNYNYVECLRLHLATKCLCPPLGDFDFSSRITRLFGVAMMVPTSVQVNAKKTLKPEILERVQLSPDDVECFPCHIHLQSTTFRIKEKTFVVSVPPPEYFLWTCEQLELKGVRQLCGVVNDCNSGKEADVAL